MISIPLLGWLLIVGATVLAAFWSPARTLALALGASWLMSLAAFYLLSLPVRPTANTLIDFWMFCMAVSQWHKARFAAGAIAGISFALIVRHFVFAWHGPSTQTAYEDMVNLLFLGECIVIGGVGVVDRWASRVSKRAAALRSGPKPGGAHGS
jgi:hypothetical protein